MRSHVMVGVLLISTSVLGQGSTGIDQARALAEEAGEFLDAGRHADAVDRLKRAEEAFHAPIHLSMMGEAYEGMGDLVAALGAYRKLSDEKLPADAPEIFRTAQRDARKKLQELEAKIPSLVVFVNGAPSGSVKAFVDGEPFDLEVATPTQINPGSRTVAAQSQGFKSATQTVELPSRAEVITVELTLEPEGAVTAPVGWGGDPATTDAPTEEPLASTSSSGFPMPPVGAFIAGGVGVVGFGMFAVFGAMSQSTASELDSCSPNCDKDKLGEDADAASTQQTIANISLAVGAAGLVTGGILWITHSPEPATAEGTARMKPSTKKELALRVHSSGPELSFSGTFY